MLGTFPFELWFKSYRCFTVGSLEFLEIAKLPLSSTSTPCSVPRRRPPTPASWRGFPAFPAINSPCAGSHASRASSSPSCCLALEPPPLATHPRRAQNLPDGRHRDAAVERPLQSTPPSSSERPSTTRAPEIDSVHSFALSSLPRLGTPPPLHPEPRRAHPTAEPPFQSSSTPTAPTNSFASS